MVDDGPDCPTDKNIRHTFLWTVHPANADAEPPRHLESALRWLRRRGIGYSFPAVWTISWRKSREPGLGWL
jgi:hypothetical protein